MPFLFYKIMIHIDWLSIYQDFDVSLPQLVGEIRTAICGTTGELLTERTTGYIHALFCDSQRGQHGRCKAGPWPRLIRRVDRAFMLRVLLETVDGVLRRQA